MRSNNRSLSFLAPFISWHTILIAILFFIALVLRFWLLGNAPFRADTMEFYKLARVHASIIDLWRNPPWQNQIPLNESLVLLLIHAGWLPTPWVVRLPFALMGLAAVFLIWAFTRDTYGRAPALLVLCWAVFNPFQLYFTRTAYHYAGAIFSSTALLWLFMRILSSLYNGTRPARMGVVLWFSVSVFAAHMHMSVWVVVALQGIWLLLVTLRAKPEIRQAILPTFAAGTLIATLVMSRWIWRAVRMLSAGSEQIGGAMWQEYTRLLPAFYAGQNGAALLLLAMVVVFSCVALVWHWDHPDTSLRRLASVVGSHWALSLIYVAVVGGGLAKITYFSAVWPHFVIFLAVGTTSFIQSIPDTRRILRGALWTIVTVGYVGLTIVPSWAIVHLDGKPTPYYKINDWVQNNLHGGAPVLTDRWFEPWNELAVHNPGDLIYTFTVPDEPLENYIALKWRDTAEQFLYRHPDAAFLQLTPRRYEREVGRWTYPETHFARVAEIENASALRLRRWRVFPEDFSENNDRLVIRIFYNTPEDLIARARRQGDPVAWWYEDGWGFLKPWQPPPGWPEQTVQALWIQAGAYRSTGRLMNRLEDLNRIPRQTLMQYLNEGRWEDYRIPTPDTALSLWNGTDAVLEVKCTLRAMAIQGPVRLRAGDQSVSFPAGLLREERFTLHLEPGAHQVPFTVPADRLLLIQSISLEPHHGG